METNALVTLSSDSVPALIIRRLETDTDPVDEEVGSMYYAVICLYEDEITLMPTKEA